MTYNKADLDKRMNGAIDNLSQEYTGLRTGRASMNMLDPIVVDVYGSKMPLNQVGTVSVPEARMLTVTVWDMSQAKAVEKSIRESGLGLNPQAEGAVIRIPVPELNEERRTELSKVAGKYAEAARVSIRNVRRDGMDSLKKMEADKDIGEDEHKRLSEEVQKLTDSFIAKVDSALAQKEKDIMTV
jgi:ribosome recycling factor|tara:strand:- start:70342 stop:70896 length:555 start_codon:yes stop_codon:yes gene_type:complete